MEERKSSQTKVDDDRCENRRPWVKPTIIEEDYDVTKNSTFNILANDGTALYS
ncbi:MAG: hypothetical protein PHY31_04195 [Smithellaceae bacterium]|nr:hypothetical protein [Smithellaceae bacterium]